jgi:putative ABC transport system permease protein
MSLEGLYRLTRQSRLVSGAYLLTDEGREDIVNEQLKRAPAVASVVSPQTMFDTFQSQLQDSLYISIAFMLGFASIISVAVIYNGTRIALSERGRELASLRVLGFTRREIATLLFGEQAVITFLAIPVGSVIGYGLASALVASFASETYRIPMVVSTRTYVFAAMAAIGAAAVSALLVRRRLNSLDLVAVLKTRE